MGTISLPHARADMLKETKIYRLHKRMTDLSYAKAIAIARLTTYVHTRVAM
jgi:hypothetical protein